MEDVGGIVTGFSAPAFRALLNRADIEWPVSVLAVNANVSARAIYAWLRGTKRPKRVELERVAGVLALELCGHCHGMGTIDPTRARVVEITESVRRRPRLVPPRSAEAYHVGRLTVDGAMNLAELDGRSIELTPVETRILVELAKRPEALLPHLELDVLVWGEQEGSSSRLTTNWSRLLDKLERIGAEAYLVTRRVTGYSLRGLSARCEREERTG